MPVTTGKSLESIMSAKMNRKIIKETAIRTGLTEDRVRTILEAFYASILKNINPESYVTLGKLGRIKLKFRDKRMTRNPKTGVSVPTPARYRVLFTPSKDLSEAAQRELL